MEEDDVHGLSGDPASCGFAQAEGVVPEIKGGGDLEEVGGWVGGLE